MKRRLALAAFGLLTATSAAHALPIANGSFTMDQTIGSGPATVNTGDITFATTKRTVPSYTVNAVAPNLTLAISPGDLGLLSSTSLVVPHGIGNNEAMNFSLAVAGLVFDFTSGVTNSRVALDLGLNRAGSFSDEYSGQLADGGGIFAIGTPVGLSETCTQSVVGHQAGLITCANSTVTIGSVPEPTSLALLGAALFGFGFIGSRSRIVF